MSTYTQFTFWGRFAFLVALLDFQAFQRVRKRNQAGNVSLAVGFTNITWNFKCFLLCSGLFILNLIWKGRRPVLCSEKSFFFFFSWEIGLSFFMSELWNNALTCIIMLLPSYYIAFNIYWSFFFTDSNFKFNE